MKAVGCLVGLFVIVAFISVGAYGVIGVVDARAHGDPYFLPLGLLTIFLLGAAYLVVGSLSTLLPAWQDGRGRPQKFVVALLVIVLPAAGVLAYAETNVVNQRPAPEVTAALAAACQGRTVSDAGAVDVSGTRINHIVVLDEGGREHTWTGYPPLAWRPPTVSDAEYVACIAGDETESVIETCSYTNGSPITRYRASRDVRLVVARTGEIETSYVATDDARGCQQTEEKDVTELHGTVTWDQIQTHLFAFVDPGGISGVARPTSQPGPGGTSEPSSDIDRSPEPTATREALAISLPDALDQRLVEANIRGDGLERVSIDLDSLADIDLVVSVEPGMILNPRRDAAQSMVVVEGDEFSLRPGESTTDELIVACAEMRRDQPDSDDVFAVSDKAASGDLKALLALPTFADQEFRIQQFAVWTVLSNPARNNYVGLGTAFDVFGSGPDKEEFATIRDLFEQAGINPRDYRAFR